MQSWTKFVKWPLLAGVVGALLFIIAQRLEGFDTHIAEFMGTQIVNRGGYSPSLVLPIGWGVHLAVALTYAALYTLLTRLPQFPTQRGPRWGVAAALALILGWLTTLITTPAIAVTTSLLAGEGLPASLPALNTGLGAAFWNHVLFFAVCFGLTVVVPDILAARAGSTASPQAGAAPPN